MGKPTGFKEFDRKKVPWRLPIVRVKDYNEVYTEPDEGQIARAGRSVYGLWCSVLPIGDRMPN